MRGSAALFLVELVGVGWLGSLLNHAFRYGLPMPITPCTVSYHVTTTAAGVSILYVTYAVPRGVSVEH